MSYFYINESDIISLQVLVLLNIANIFIMFFMFFTFLFYEDFRHLDNNNRTPPMNLLNIYSVNFSDIYFPVFEENFPHNERCSICLEDFDITNESNIVRTRSCHHTFHEHCLKEWIKIRPTCPYCNINMVARFIQDL